MNKSIGDVNVEWGRTHGNPYPDGKKLLLRIVSGKDFMKNKKFNPNSSSNIYSFLNQPHSIESAVSQYREYGQNCADPILVELIKRINDIESYPKDYSFSAGGFYDYRTQKRLKREVGEVNLTDMRNVYFIIEQMLKEGAFIGYQSSPIYIYSNPKKDGIVDLFGDMLIDRIDFHPRSQTRIVTWGENELDNDFIESCMGLRYIHEKMYTDDVSFKVSDGNTTVSGKIIGESDLLGSAACVKAKYVFDDFNCARYSFQREFNELPKSNVSLLKRVVGSGKKFRIC